MIAHAQEEDEEVGQDRTRLTKARSARIEVRMSQYIRLTIDIALVMKLPLMSKVCLLII